MAAAGGGEEEAGRRISEGRGGAERLAVDPVMAAVGGVVQEKGAADGASALVEDKRRVVRPSCRWRRRAPGDRPLSVGGEEEVAGRGVERTRWECAIEEGAGAMRCRLQKLERLFL